MVSKWLIDLKGFENYVFGEDKELYRLPFSDSKGRTYSLKKVAKCPIKKRWIFCVNGKVEKRSEGQLRPHLILDLKPILLIKEEILPF